MNTVTINCASIKNAEQFHEALARGLDFPEWYGHNLDALYDCLTSLTHVTSLVFYDWDCVDAFSEGFHRALTDAEMDNPTLTVTFE